MEEAGERGLGNQDEECGGSPKGTREPQQVLDQGIRGSTLGEGRQILLLVGGEASRGKALSREVVPLIPPALPGIPASHHPPLKIYLFPADPC